MVPSPSAKHTRRRAVVLLASGILLLLMAACGRNPPSTSTSSSPNQGGSSRVQKTLAFAQCMRSKGVSNFPDPDSKGDFDKITLSQLEAGNPVFSAAHRACEHLLPNGGQPSQVQVQQAWADMRNFAHCMRSHGVSNWPDPRATSPQDSRPFFNTPNNMDLNAPQASTATNTCQRLFHADNPLDTTQ